MNLKWFPLSFTLHVQLKGVFRTIFRLMVFTPTTYFEIERRTPRKKSIRYLECNWTRFFSREKLSGLFEPHLHALYHTSCSI